MQGGLDALHLGAHSIIVPPRICLVPSLVPLLAIMCPPSGLHPVSSYRAPPSEIFPLLCSVLFCFLTTVILFCAFPKQQSLPFTRQLHIIHHSLFDFHWVTRHYAFDHRPLSYSFHFYQPPIQILKMPLLAYPSLYAEGGLWPTSNAAMSSQMQSRPLLKMRPSSSRGTFRRLIYSEVWFRCG
jgi:hypothetical protein